MIRASANTQALIERLCRQAAAIAAAALAERGTSRRDWYSPRALWPDLFGENRHGE